MGKEIALERGLEVRELQIRESEGATGNAKVCAIISSLQTSHSPDGNQHISGFLQSD